jgi:hypothetical protein
MAINIDKSLASLPMGLTEAEFEGGDEPVIEIEVEDPESMSIGIDGLEIQLEPEPEIGDEEFDANLAEFMDESQLATLASDLIELVDADITSRKDWSDAYVKGLEVLGMKYEERAEPWMGACGVYSPLLTEAAIRFQSEMITETFPAQGPVKTLIVGEVTPENEDAAERVREDMNYRLTDEMIEYRPEHERLLYSLGLAGSAFKKVYYDPTLRRQVAMYIAAEDIIMPYGASNIYNAERATHVMRKTENEVKKLMSVGFYREVELGEPVRNFTDIEKKKAEEQGYTITDDERYQILEVHADYDLPGYESDDGVAYPYIITIERGTQKVLAIRRNWEEGDERHLKRQHFVQYNYVPGFGAYGLGFIHIIGGYARAGTSLIRQLIDAGTLSNLPGGLKTRGLRIKGDDTPIAPGEFRDVDIPSGTLRDNITHLPYKEPSQVLAALLEKITDDGRRLAAIADLKFSDMSAQAPVGTTLALLERQLKTMSAVQARVHASLKMEFKLLKQIIRDYMPENYSYVPMGGDRAAKQGDYDLVEVIPVSDPNASTMAQRIMQYQAALQLAQGAPQIYDLPQLHRQMLEVLGIKNAEKLVPVEDDQTPRDPVSENMSFLTGKPTKAFIYQDHRAHIATHMSLLQDPMVMQMIGQSPMAQQMGAAIMAHVAEHMAFEYRSQIEQQLGVPMTAPDAELDPQIEVQLSRLVAQAAQQLLQSNVQKAQAAQAQQQAQDPLVQMQQAELQLKQQELQLKDQDSQRDYEIAQQKLQLEAQRLMLEARNKQGEDPRLKAAMAQQDMQHKEQMHRQKMQHTQQAAAVKARTQAAQAAQKAMQAVNRPAQPRKD